MKSQLEDGPMAFPAVNGREYIWTYSKTKFFFDGPGPCIKIVDIAHHLSLLCRWTGACYDHYSIAEHCVRCSYYPYFGNDDPTQSPLKAHVPEFALRKLMHDAAEAYVNDLNKPLKIELGRNGPSPYDEIESRIEMAIYKKYAMSEVIPEPERKAVKEADIALAMTEARDLMGQNSVAHYESARPLKFKIEPWSPRVAEKKFLDRFQELM